MNNEQMNKQEEQKQDIVICDLHLTRTINNARNKYNEH